MKHLVDSYSLLPEAQAIAARLLAGEPAYTEREKLPADFNAVALAQTRIACLLSQPTLMVHGHAAAACIGPCRVQAPQAVKGLFEFMAATFCAPLFDYEDADFLIFVDAATWSTLDPVNRERLVFHELCHLEQKQGLEGPRFDKEGRPVIGLKDHDYEFFRAEALAYGPQVIEALGDAAIDIADGYREADERQKRLRRRAS